MHQYLIDTRFAVTNLLTRAVEDDERLSNSIAELSSAEERLRVHKWDFESSDLNNDFQDPYVMAVFGRNRKYR